MKSRNGQYFNSSINFWVTEQDYPTNSTAVWSGEKVTLACPASANDTVAWFRDEQPLKPQRPRVRLLRQRVRLKPARPEDTGMWACLVNGHAWRRLELYVEHELNDEAVGLLRDDDLGKTLGALRPEEETNELELADDKGACCSN